MHEAVQLIFRLKGILHHESFYGTKELYSFQENDLPLQKYEESLPAVPS